jgi:hypothetical protein
MFSLTFLTACHHQQVMMDEVTNSPAIHDADSQDEKLASSNQKLVPELQAYLAPSQKNLKLKTDTANRRSNRTTFLKLKKSDERIIVNVSDAASQKFVSKTFPGIKWVEQRVDKRTILRMDYENDLITYANTDRYFTNGIAFDLQAAWIAKSLLKKLMIPYMHTSFVTYNISFVQDIYTPTDTRVAPSLYHDRPYASLLYFGFRQTVVDPLRELKISSQIKAGYIGPYSLGSSLQTVIHKTFPSNDKPVGWETQINSDIILDYYMQVQKALVNRENLTLLAGMAAEAGTLYDYAAAGFQLQAGRAEPVFGLIENEPWPELEYYLFAKTDVRFVAYNALLQGGMVNHNNVFTLNGNEIQRVVGSAEAGIHFRYKSIGVELAQHYLSPEYKGGLWHKWGRISLMFRI